MAASTALWTENAGAVYNAIEYRQLLRALTPKAGVFDVDALKVTQRGAGANMSVDVAKGAITVAGTSAAPDQGYYFQHHDATTNLAIDASDPSNPRDDLVVQRFRDTVYGGAADDGALVIVKGTPAGSPVEPAIPANSVVVARVRVGAGVASITNAVIFDRRVYASAVGSLAVVTSATRPATPRPFDWIAETDTGKNLRRNVGNTTWEPFGNVIICTSSTRPATPYKGLVIIETDTDKVLEYQTATTGWTPPWNLPWGRLATGGTPTGTGARHLGVGATETEALTTSAVTLVANRRIRIKGEVRLQGSGAFISEANIRRGSTVGGTRLLGPVERNVSDIFGGRDQWNVEVEDTGYTPGSVQWVISGRGADIYDPTFYAIDDLGPAAAPA